MNEWSKETLFKQITNENELRPLYESIQNSAYKQSFHIQPISGLLNDPNGFIYKEGLWHLFYQWFPFGPVHGLKHWYHVVSSDLIHWKNLGVALKPDTFLDNKGVYSGSALSVGDDIYLYYTGNHRSEDWVRTPYTCLAKLSLDGTITKIKDALFGPVKGFTDNQRDPKIIHNKEDGRYYILLGAEDEHNKGCLLLFGSDHPDRDFSFINKVLVPGYENFGNMWECPSIERFDDKDVLFICPQNIFLPGRSYAKHHNGYIIGHMDYSEAVFLPEGSYHELDHGFDFYAASCAANTKSCDKKILIGWMGNSDCTYPVTDNESWSGCLTLPRELKLGDRRLIQTPVPGLSALRVKELDPSSKDLPAKAEFEIETDGKDFYLSLFKNRRSRGLMISFNSYSKKLGVDRSGLSNRFNTDWGESRTLVLEKELTHLRIFIDHSSLEIFVNNGVAVMSSRIFPTEHETQFEISPNANFKLWELADSMENNFIL